MGRVAADEEEHVRRLLALLDKRLAHRPDPAARLLLRWHDQQRRMKARLSLQLELLGAHVVSHEEAETAEQAVRLAVSDLERQIERHTAHQRGEPAYGVPGRRLPESTRPHPRWPNG